MQSLSTKDLDQDGHQEGSVGRLTASRQRMELWTDDSGRVHLEVYLGEELEFQAMRRGGMREGLRLAQTFLDDGPEGFQPRPRGAEYMEIAQAVASLEPGDRFTSHRVADLVHEDGTHDKALVLKNVSSALTKLRKREVAYLQAAGKQGKSILYELREPVSAAAVMRDLTVAFGLQTP
jgi:hypothetical protein